MKKYLSIVLFGITAISLTGCYTQLVVPENNDTYVYHEPIPVIIYYPAHEPILVQALLPHQPKEPVRPIYKIRKPETPPPNNDRNSDHIRNSGGRNEGGRRSRR
jgi:hypothetical protein